MSILGQLLMSSANIENTILCSNVRIGAKSKVKDCEFGPGFEAKAEGESSDISLRQ